MRRLSGAVEVGVARAHGLAVLVHERGGVELGVDHHGVRAGVPEQRLDHVDRRVVVQMLGRERAPAIVRAQHELAAVGPARSRLSGETGEAGADLAVGDHARVSGALEQVGRARAGAFLVRVPAVAGGHVRGGVEGLDVADDLGDDTAEAVADRQHPRAVELRRLDVQQVVGAAVGCAGV